VGKGALARRAHVPAESMSRYRRARAVSCAANCQRTGAATWEPWPEKYGK